MTDTLQEYCNSRGAAMRVDRAAGVIRGVKILGLESRNGRTYLPAALAEAARLYEDAKVNVNHPKQGPSAPRDYQDRIGSIRGVALRPGEGLFGDFHFNPKHALAEQLIWAAEHAPENVGFSHNVEARVARRDGRVVVESIVRVQSVDLVADPATTRGLFEAAPEAESVELAEPFRRQDASAGAVESVRDLEAQYPELVQSVRRERDEEVRRLAEEVERLAALVASRDKRETARRLLREFGLPDPDGGEPRAKILCGERFMESLAAAPDEPTMRALVSERARLVRALAGDDARPRSVDQHRAGGARPFDAQSFVEAIT